MWIPDLACPQCRRALVPTGMEWQCRECGRCYGWHQQIFRAAAPEALARLEPFFRQYRAVREQDGYRTHDAGYYRRLPHVPDDDPRAVEWRLRRESFDRFSRVVLEPSANGSGLRAIDLGAGNGWLSHQLTAVGHRAVAIDVLDDDADGLGAGRHYRTPFALVQAQFDALPFMNHICDLAVFNASLHYAADPERTLLEAARVVAPGGAIVVMDSPMFRSQDAGEAMVRSLGADFSARHGFDQLQRPGLGYLTFDLLNRAAAGLGLSARFYATRGPLGWQLRRQLARWRLGRSPAAFGVWVAR